MKANGRERSAPGHLFITETRGQVCPKESNLLGEVALSTDQLTFYQHKLEYEMDSADLCEALERGEPVVVVDGRSVIAHATEHIPGAISLPHRDISFNTTESLDRSKLYVCYCDGIGCNASTKTALKLLTLGFPVRELIGGLDWWKRDGHATHGEEVLAATGVRCSC